MLQLSMFKGFVGTNKDKRKEAFETLGLIKENEKLINNGKDNDPESGDVVKCR